MLSRYVGERKPRAAGSDVQRRVLSRRGRGRGSAGLRGGGRLVQARGRRGRRERGEQTVRNVHTRPL